MRSYHLRHLPQAIAPSLAVRHQRPLAGTSGQGAVISSSRGIGVLGASICTGLPLFPTYSAETIMMVITNRVASTMATVLYPRGTKKPPADDSPEARFE